MTEPRRSTSPSSREPRVRLPPSNRAQGFRNISERSSQLADQALPGRRLHLLPGQAGHGSLPEGRPEDPGALRPQRSDGTRRHPGHQGSRPAARQGHHHHRHGRGEGRCSRRSSTARRTPPSNATLCSGPRPCRPSSDLRAGKKLPASIWTIESQFDATNAAAALPTRQY